MLLAVCVFCSARFTQHQLLLLRLGRAPLLGHRCVLLRPCLQPLGEGRSLGLLRPPACHQVSCLILRWRSMCQARLALRPFGFRPATSACSSRLFAWACWVFSSFIPGSVCVDFLCKGPCACDAARWPSSCAALLVAFSLASWHSVCVIQATLFVGAAHAWAPAPHAN